jgi:hypothetical protein
VDFDQVVADVVHETFTRGATVCGVATATVALLGTTLTSSLGTTLSTDYDAPRVRPDDEPDDTSELIKAHSSKSASNATLEDEANLDEGLELPGADLSHAELAIEVVPRQFDEIVCSSCFLVHHHSAFTQLDPPVCRDCA